MDQYFDHNPISQLGVLVTKNKRAERVSELGGKCDEVNKRKLITQFGINYAFLRNVRVIGGGVLLDIGWFCASKH